ncbi:MAG: hypothetical protein ACTHJL_05890 [Amnibacterium sp.]
MLIRSVTCSGDAMLGTRRRHRPDLVALADLPRPGVADPVRAFAYDALRAAPSALWLQVRGRLDDALGTLLAGIPDLRDTGARWSGAGVLPGLRTEWWAFSADDASLLLLTSDALELARLRAALRKVAGAVVQHETTATVPSEVLRACEQATAVPVWELAGFSRLAPRALLESGFATIAA